MSDGRSNSPTVRHALINDLLRAQRARVDHPPPVGRKRDAGVVVTIIGQPGELSLSRHPVQIRRSVGLLIARRPLVHAELKRAAIRHPLQPGHARHAEPRELSRVAPGRRPDDDLGGWTGAPGYQSNASPLNRPSWRCSKSDSTGPGAATCGRVWTRACHRLG